MSSIFVFIYSAAQIQSCFNHSFNLMLLLCFCFMTHQQKHILWSVRRKYMIIWLSMTESNQTLFIRSLSNIGFRWPKFLTKKKKNVQKTQWNRNIPESTFPRADSKAWIKSMKNTTTIKESQCLMSSIHCFKIEKKRKQPRHWSSSLIVKLWGKKSSIEKVSMVIYYRICGQDNCLLLHSTNPVWLEEWQEERAMTSSNAETNI